MDKFWKVLPWLLVTALLLTVIYGAYKMAKSPAKKKEKEGTSGDGSDDSGGTSGSGSDPTDETPDSSETIS